MLPVGFLMIEHRIIERMINLMSLELKKITEENKVDLDFLSAALDFLKIYADKCHHGKEEDILFNVLEQKSLSGKHKEMIKELLQEHIASRGMVAGLIESRDRYGHGDNNALKDISDSMHALVQLYSQHIDKEDKIFFLPVMAYLNKQEQDKMTRDFRIFDRNFIHETYKNILKEWESEKSNS